MIFYNNLPVLSVQSGGQCTLCGAPVSRILTEGRYNKTREFHNIQQLQYKVTCRDELKFPSDIKPHQCIKGMPIAKL